MKIWLRVILVLALGKAQLSEDKKKMIGQGNRERLRGGEKRDRTPNWARQQSHTEESF